MALKSILFKNEWDLDTDGAFDDDDDDYWEELKREQEQFWDDSLKKYGLKFTDVPAFFEGYKKRLEEYMKRIGCSCRHRVTVSNGLCDYLEEHEPDEEDYFFWQVCMFDDDHILFDDDKEHEKQDIYRWFFGLLDRMERAEKIYINQKKSAEEYVRLASEIEFLSEPVGEIDMGKVKAVLLEYKFSGECFEDNLEKLADRICRSPSLYKIAPLVFYAALTRYTKKMTDVQDYKMNFTAALRRIEYSVKKNNGKNVTNFGKHIDLFVDLCNALCPDEENRNLCYGGFNIITNIGECDIIFGGRMGMLRPLKNYLNEGDFGGFPHGDADNPCNIESMVADIDLIQYEKYDKQLPKSKKFLGKLQQYIIEHGNVVWDYIDLIDEGRTEECIPIVSEIINGSQIAFDDCSVRMQALLQAIVVKELMTCISEVTRGRLVDMMGKFDRFILKDLLI
ncbi:MAG: hypothetical protein NC120_10630 [Ruminococcus sp.]|nr:hypothetical protein [Ruminococcus sp.]